MKQFLIHISEDYNTAKENLQKIKYYHVEECIRHIQSKRLSLVVDEDNLKLIQERYSVTVVGEIEDIARQVQMMVGSGDRFSKNVIDAKII